MHRSPASAIAPMSSSLSDAEAAEADGFGGWAGEGLAAGAGLARCRGSRDSGMPTLKTIFKILIFIERLDKML